MNECISCIYLNLNDQLLHCQLTTMSSVGSYASFTHLIREK